jgi:hypothetical protein
MKNKYLLLPTLMLLFGGFSASAQWTDVMNTNINFSYKVQDNYFGGSNDVADGQADPVIRNDFHIISNLGDSWTGWECYVWECVSPCYNSSNPIVHSFYDEPFNTDGQITAQMYESDNGNNCTYQSGDDNYWNGYATFREGLNYIPVTYQSTNFYPGAWNPNLGQSGSGWIFPVAESLVSFNQIWTQVWRYRYGDNNGALLNFGTLNIGDTKRDVNSNRSPQPNDGLMFYTSTNGINASPDVWYEFTLNSSASVSITTTSGRTDFDTYIRLYDNSDNFIDADYDSGGNLTSLLTENLCSGTYKFMVEGYQSLTGVFEVSVAANAPDPLDIDAYQIAGVSCPGESDGSVDWSLSGGVGLLTVGWSGSGLPAFDGVAGLDEGTYTASLTDACGTSANETVVIGNGDNTPPVANCITPITLTVSQGVDAELLPEDLNDGSTDNCGIQTLQLQGGTFTLNDVGTHTVSLTVYDAALNSDVCTAQVNVISSTGIEEEELNRNISIFPNPNAGLFSIDLSAVQLENDASMEVLDNLGRVVFSDQIVSAKTTLDLTHVETGLYLVKITNNGIVASKRFSVTR